MEAIDTPCPPHARRKRQRGLSPSPDPEPTILSQYDDDVDQFTTDISAARYGGKPPNSLAIAPKRRRIPANRLLQAAMKMKGQEEQNVEVNTQKEKLKEAREEFSSFTRQRRVSTRSQTSRRETFGEDSERSIDLSLTLPSFPGDISANMSIIPDVSLSDMDSTSTTIAPRSSPNVSSASIGVDMGPPVAPRSSAVRSRRRISQILATRAFAAAAKPAQPTKPKLRQPSIASKVSKSTSVKSTDKSKSTSRPTLVQTKSKPRTGAETSSASNTKARQALKPISRGMNPAARAVQTDSEKDKVKKPSSVAVGRLRLSKTESQVPKAHSDSEFTKRKAAIKSAKPPPRVTRKSASAYPKLDVSLKPELYDPTWMDTQEGVLTQLLNEVLTAGTARESPSESSMRNDLLQIYNTRENIALFERLKASILHGALRPSEDYLEQHLKLGEDLGLRDKFTRIFTQSYTLQSLKLAMEIVTGRSIGSDKTTDADVKKFFETFFIDIDDDDRNWESYGTNAHGSMRLWTESDTTGSKAWELRRTIQRSLQLVQLLDHGKTTGVFNDMLFRPDSEIKKSETVITQAFKIILPTLGNPIRVLKNCNYTVSHSQKPEEEFDYTIHNIKVDLRSGTRLAKLAELLAPPASERVPDAKTALRAISVVARAKAEKTANVLVVLNYLYSIGCLPDGSVKPADIVDGHREVTLSVLWALVAGKVGLRRLVNWTDMQSETRRLWRKYKLDMGLLDDSLETSVLDEVETDERTYLRRIELWVHGITAPRRIAFGNPSTTFTNGDIIKAILDEYQPLSDIPTTCSKKSEETSLPDRLRALGCSDAFIALFNPTANSSTSKIVNDNFIIATLAFLASKILSSTCTTRAALTVQKFWRTASLRKFILVKLAKLIEETKAAQKAEKDAKEEKAAVIIQRAWRNAISRKIEDVMRRITGVQALARGVLVRQKTDYSFHAGKKNELKEKPAVALPPLVEADPYALKKHQDTSESAIGEHVWNLSGMLLGRKGSKKLRKVKTKESKETLDLGGGDIWQDLADDGELA